MHDVMCGDTINMCISLMRLSVSHYWNSSFWYTQKRHTTLCKTRWAHCWRHYHTIIPILQVLRPACSRSTCRLPSCRTQCSGNTWNINHLRRDGQAIELWLMNTNSIITLRGIFPAIPNTIGRSLSTAERISRTAELTHVTGQRYWHWILFGRLGNRSYCSIYW